MERKNRNYKLKIIILAFILAAVCAVSFRISPHIPRSRGAALSSGSAAEAVQSTGTAFADAKPEEDGHVDADAYYSKNAKIISEMEEIAHVLHTQEMQVKKACNNSLDVLRQDYSLHLLYPEARHSEPDDSIIFERPIGLEEDAYAIGEIMAHNEAIAI